LMLTVGGAQHPQGMVQIAEIEPRAAVKFPF
jgi:hypothetical protein